jgi:hypothetical protein
MPISRMQQPRQLYGLGSIVKKIGRAAKKVVKSDVGKAALAVAAIKFGGPLAAKAFPGTFGSTATSPFMRALGRGQFLGDTGIFSAGKTALFGSNAVGPNVSEGLFQKALSSIPGGKVGAGIAAASIAGGMLTPEAQEDVDQLKASGDQGLLKAYLDRYYRNLNPIGGKDPEDYESEVQSFVRTNMARGGDTAEENAMQASGIMNLPLNQNPAGVTELDLRETGGFIPPVGVKEKADDIPAMLSNNEFVFTADAVRGMGDGDVNKGAQRMYDMMKKLENGGRV